MQNTLNTLIQKLTKLAEQSKNKKLLWEEMQIISQKSFELQEKIMDELDKVEALETDIVKVQAAFAARESIWDLISQITDREQELKEKTHHKETPAERAKRHKEVMAEAHEHHCCCGHHHHEGCCGHHHDVGCEHKAQKCAKPRTRKHCCRKGK